MSSCFINQGHKYGFFLVFLIVIGAYLRFRDFPGIWIGDVGRDYLVAKHIFSDGVKPLVGHWASGFNFHYPPFYYYFLGIIYQFFPRLFRLIGFFTFFHLISIIFLFRIGRKLIDKNTGIIAAAFYTFSASSIFYSRNLWPAYIIIPFSLLTFWLFLEYLDNSKLINLVLSLLIMISASLIHYSMLSYLIILPLTTLIFNKKKLAQVVLILLI